MIEAASIRYLRDANRALAERLRTDPSAGENFLAQAEFVGDPVLLGESLATEAVRTYLQGDIDGAVQQNVEARRLLEHQPFEDSDPFFIWLIYTTDGLTGEARGEIDTARTNFETAATIGRSAKLIKLTGRSLMSLGFIANRQSDPVSALSYFLQLLHLPDLDDSTTAATYMYLAGLFEDQQQWELASFYLGEGLARSGRIAPDVEGAMRGLDAELLARTGQLAQAEAALELAGQITIPNTIHASRLDESRARVMFEYQQYDQAEEIAARATKRLRDQGAPSYLGKLSVQLCEVYLATNRPAQVLSLLEETDLSVLPTQQLQRLVLLKIQALRELNRYEEAASSHDMYAELFEATHLDARAFYRLHGQLVDSHTLESQHAALISRQAELARLQSNLASLMDSVANDLNSPLTTLQLVFGSIGRGTGTDIGPRLKSASSAVERMTTLAQQFSEVQEETTEDLLDLTLQQPVG